MWAPQAGGPLRSPRGLRPGSQCFSLPGTPRACDLLAGTPIPPQLLQGASLPFCLCAHVAVISFLPFSLSSLTTVSHSLDFCL